MLGRYTTGPGSEREEYQGGSHGSLESTDVDEADHPVRLVPGQVTDVTPGHRLSERDGRLDRGECRYRNLRRPAGVVLLGPCAVAQVETLVADDPLVRDRIVVVEDECDRSPVRDGH